jgi:hypothetical protein
VEESAESKAFREAMATMTWDEALDELVKKHADARPNTPDGAALLACCRYVGMVGMGRVKVHVVEPLRPCDDHMDFDREVCKAGLKRFIRKRMESDGPEDSALIDPGIALFGVDLGEWVLVLEASEGLRFRSGIDIEWLREPASC